MSDLMLSALSSLGYKLLSYTVHCTVYHAVYHSVSACHSLCLFGRLISSAFTGAQVR